MPENGDGSNVSWYLFSIPLDTIIKENIGNYEGIDISSSFRIILSDFGEPIHLRLSKLYLQTNRFELDTESYCNESLLLYPNPTNGELNLLSDAENILTVNIFDTKGNKVYYSNNSENYIPKLNLSFLNNGLYFMIVEFKDFTCRKKIIINK